MLVLGDVTCLHCGHVTGSWVGERGEPLRVGGLRYRAATDTTPDDEELIRCARCGGSVFLDGAGPIRSETRIRRIHRLREQIAALDAASGRAA